MVSKNRARAFMQMSESACARGVGLCAGADGLPVNGIGHGMWGGPAHREVAAISRE